MAVECNLISSKTGNYYNNAILKALKQPEFFYDGVCMTTFIWFLLNLAWHGFLVCSLRTLNGRWLKNFNTDTRVLSCKQNTWKQNFTKSLPEKMTTQDMVGSSCRACRLNDKTCLDWSWELGWQWTWLKRNI